MKVAETFVAKDTVIEALNPMTKILAVFTLGFGTMFFSDLWLGFALIILLFVVAYLAKLLKPFTVLMLSFGVPITLMLLFIQGFYGAENSTFIADFGFAKLGLEGVVYALKVVSTLLVFLGTFYLMNRTTDTGKLVAALTKSGLSPKAGYLVLATLNVVPQMQKRMATIQEAQAARGVETKGHLISRLKAFIPLLGPVIMSSLTDAQERGMTLETRGFGIKGVKQTSLVVVEHSRLDRIIQICLLLFFAVIVGSAILR